MENEYLTFMQTFVLIGTILLIASAIFGTYYVKKIKAKKNISIPPTSKKNLALMKQREDETELADPVNAGYSGIQTGNYS